MRRSKHIYKYGKIVIGSDLDAVTYAHDYHLPLIMNVPGRPFQFDYHDARAGVGKVLKTADGEIAVGPQKLCTWEQLCFDMSLRGQIPLTKPVDSIRIHGNRLNIVFNDIASVKIDFDELLVFDDAGVHGLPPPREKIEEHYKVMDWFDVKSGTKHEYDCFFDEDEELVREIHFYPSERIDGTHNKKDLVAVSYLNKKQLNDINCFKS